MAPSPFDLKQRNVWVIGGAGYLGQATVSLLASMEASVLCVDLEDRAQRFVEEANLGDHVTAGSLNAHDTAAVESFLTNQLASNGAPDGLVVMTYASTAKRLEELSVEDFDKANHGNLAATFALTRTVASAMADRGRGSIVLFSSMYGTVSPDPGVYEAPMMPNPIEYGVGKAGIQQMARYFAVHYGSRGVRCNSLSPGPFPNPGIQQSNPVFIERLAKRVPLNRVGTAAEIAGSVAFLLSDASSFVTAHNLAVDGGWTAW